MTSNEYKGPDYWNPQLPENLEKLAEELCISAMHIVDSKGLKMAYHIPPPIARQIVLRAYAKAHFK